MFKHRGVGRQAGGGVSGKGAKTRLERVTLASSYPGTFPEVSQKPRSFMAIDYYVLIFPTREWDSSRRRRSTGL